MRSTHSYRRMDISAIVFLGVCCASVYITELSVLHHKIFPSSPQEQNVVAWGSIPETKSDIKKYEKRPGSIERTSKTPLFGEDLDVYAAINLYNDLDFNPDFLSEQPVPRIFLASIPENIQSIQDRDQRKTLFIQMVLPLILKVNEEIASDRQRLLEMSAREDAWTVEDQIFLKEKSQQYGLKNPSLPLLLKRIDIIPPSLALAQAAEESGWGTSRFARQGNALFGQTTVNPSNGLAPQTPQNQDDEVTVFIRSFPSLLDAVRSYAENLNKHQAYSEFRTAREKMRLADEVLDGSILSEKLLRYSERKQDYIYSLKTIMRHNNLYKYDTARLSDEPFEIADFEASLS